jgi:hypothetical protein
VNEYQNEPQKIDPRRGAESNAAEKPAHNAWVDNPLIRFGVVSAIMVALNFVGIFTGGATLAGILVGGALTAYEIAKNSTAASRFNGSQKSYDSASEADIAVQRSRTVPDIEMQQERDNPAKTNALVQNMVAKGTNTPMQMATRERQETEPSR